LQLYQAVQNVLLTESHDLLIGIEVQEKTVLEDVLFVGGQVVHCPVLDSTVQLTEPAAPKLSVFFPYKNRVTLSGEVRLTRTRLDYSPSGLIINSPTPDKSKTAPKGGITLGLYSKNPFNIPPIPRKHLGNLFSSRNLILLFAVFQ
jgi:hypothetical protein